MVNLPNPGQANWDVPLNTALASLAHTGVNPQDHALIAWNYPPIMATSGLTAVSGTVYMVRLPRVTQATTVTNIHFMRGNTAAVDPVANQNFAGIYNVIGDRLAQTGDITTVFNAASGFRTLPLSSPYNMSPGYYYLAIVQNATTPANLWIAASAGPGVSQPNMSAANGLWTSGPTGQTSLPATVSPGTRTLIGQTVWGAIS